MDKAMARIELVGALEEADILGVGEKEEMLYEECCCGSVEGLYMERDGGMEIVGTHCERHGWKLCAEVLREFFGDKE